MGAKTAKRWKSESKRRRKSTGRENRGLRGVSFRLPSEEEVEGKGGRQGKGETCGDVIERRTLRQIYIKQLKTNFKTVCENTTVHQSQESECRQNSPKLNTCRGFRGLLVLFIGSCRVFAYVLFCKCIIDWGKTRCPPLFINTYCT